MDLEKEKKALERISRRRVIFSPEEVKSCKISSYGLWLLLTQRVLTVINPTAWELSSYGDYPVVYCPPSAVFSREKPTGEVCFVPEFSKKQLRFLKKGYKNIYYIAPSLKSDASIKLLRTSPANAADLWFEKNEYNLHNLMIEQGERGK